MFLIQAKLEGGGAVGTRRDARGAGAAYYAG
jgi:hypothetical protein